MKKNFGLCLLCCISIFHSYAADSTKQTLLFRTSEFTGVVVMNFKPDTTLYLKFCCLDHKAFQVKKYDMMYCILMDGSLVLLDSRQDLKSTDSDRGTEVIIPYRIYEGGLQHLQASYIKKLRVDFGDDNRTFFIDPKNSRKIKMLINKSK